MDAARLVGPTVAADALWKWDARQARTGSRKAYGPESRSGQISPKRRGFSFEGGGARIGRPSGHRPRFSS